MIILNWTIISRIIIINCVICYRKSCVYSVKFVVVESKYRIIV